MTAVGSCHRSRPRSCPRSHPCSCCSRLHLYPPSFASLGLLPASSPSFTPASTPAWPLRTPRSHLIPTLVPHSRPCSGLVCALLGALVPALFGPSFPPCWHLVWTLVPASLAPCWHPRIRFTHSFILALRLPSLVRIGLHSAALALAHLYSPSFVVDHHRSSLLALLVAGTTS